MINKTSSTLGESSKDDARLNTLVEQLRSKLANFVLLDRQGELIGEVKDFILDANHQLKLVGAPLALAPGSRCFLLSSKRIKKVEAANKSVLVDIAKAEVEYLPEYVMTETPNIETSFESKANQEPDNNSSLLPSDPEVLQDELFRLL